MQKLNEQVRQYTKSGTAPGRMVGFRRNSCWNNIPS